METKTFIISAHENTNNVPDFMLRGLLLMKFDTEYMSRLLSSCPARPSKVGFAIDAHLAHVLGQHLF